MVGTVQLGTVQPVLVFGNNKELLDSTKESGRVFRITDMWEGEYLKGYSPFLHHYGARGLRAMPAQIMFRQFPLPPYGRGNFLHLLGETRSKIWLRNLTGGKKRYEVRENRNL